MQAVKWRIAFFYFDMNIFQIRICLAETFDRSPFLSERFNDGQARGYIQSQSQTYPPWPGA